MSEARKRNLREELGNVLPEYQARVHRPGALGDEELIAMTTRPDADPAMYHPDHVELKNVADAEEVITSLDELRGDEALKKGEVAFVLLAGGAGTRMGGPKLFAQIPQVGTSILAWKMMQAGNMPVWIMVGAGELKTVAHHLEKLVLPPGARVQIFEQFEGYRLSPDLRLETMGAPNVPDLYPLGHGDVGPALVESGVLDDNPDVKHIFVCNVDNVLASIHSGMLGRHINGGFKVSCELVERRKGDRGGVLAWVDNKLQIAEDFRLPDGFADASLFHNTNTMIIDTDVLRWAIPWRWHRVSKRVGHRIVIQYERLLQQYTEECETNFVMVPRDARYLPVKKPEDLERAGEVLSSYHFT